MFARTTQAILSVVAFSAAFSAAGTPGPIPAGSCNTGPVQCCDSLQTAGNDPATTMLLGAIGVSVTDVNALIGLTCTPISVIGLGQAGCNTSPVCCENNNVGGAISLGCVPVTL
ncbi:hypothetical protein NLI96_g4092 [Meripilus lineatus]|uniref:Hydrophobin n=1 Tax=Meripilus lineatus TaxID=2056292 RepID=A0AAD5V5I4_9APHY|nr:hypothetical protein NLI96_g4092 [Physisporinus lineatus]